MNTNISKNLTEIKCKAYKPIEVNGMMKFLKKPLGVFYYWLLVLVYIFI